MLIDLKNMNFVKLFKIFASLALFVFCCISLFSYDEMDPSFNKATSLSIENLAGVLGAYFSDLIFELFGLAGFIIILVPLAWSFVYYRYGLVSWYFFRIISLLIALNMASLLTNQFKFKSAYFIHSGGAVGLLWHKFFINYISQTNLLITASVIFAFAYIYALALTMENWGSVFRIFKNLISCLFSLSNTLIRKLFALSPRRDEVGNFKKIETESQFSKVKEKIPPKLKENSKPNSNIPNSFVKNISINQQGFVLPSTKLLKDFPINKDLINQNNALIKKHKEELLQILADFGVSGEIIGAGSGPVVTLYELEPAAGTKSSRVIGLADDISRSMRSVSARIAVIPGRNAIGIELPNKQRETVYLKELLESSEYKDSGYDLPIILGKDISGSVIVADLARMPHLLVAGTTGSGKSVAINTMIMSLVYALTPDECKFIMVDPKMLELSVYDNIPHLLTNVVTEPGKAVVALKWVVKEMENRYRLMSNLSVRNIHNYNERIRDAISNGEVLQRTVQTGFNPETGRPIIEQVELDMKTLPFIVVIVDEMADLMLVAGKEIETSIQRLAQMARAAGIHIIMATQRPSVDVITGVIKANFPTRISFQVTSKIDSRTILGEQGAEQLLGKGDMLYMAGGSKINRIHGPFVGDHEVESVVSYLKSQASPNYMSDITSEDFTPTNNSSGGNANIEQDELYKQAVEIVQLEGKASTSFIQRCLKIGYNRAANIMEQMEKDGLVSKPNHMGKREILM